MERLLEMVNEKYSCMNGKKIIVFIEGLVEVLVRYKYSTFRLQDFFDLKIELKNNTKGKVVGVERLMYSFSNSLLCDCYFDTYKGDEDYLVGSCKTCGADVPYEFGDFFLNGNFSGLNIYKDSIDDLLIFVLKNM